MRTLVVAPHPDDETLGVGGTLLRKKQEGSSIAWLIMTSIKVEKGWSQEKVDTRKIELAQIESFFGFDKVYQLGFDSKELDKVPKKNIVASINEVFKEFQPTEIFLPHFSDIHSDHKVTFDSVVSCTKWFRNYSIKRILTYETLSETEFGSNKDFKFNPNIFVNIESTLTQKLQAMQIYKSEIDNFPFPRSLEAISALAAIRGSASGFRAAEAFELIKEII
jgi:LmbE family N-acetylglucosaminyl deacetylase